MRTLVDIPDAELEALQLRRQGGQGAAEQRREKSVQQRSAAGFRTALTAGDFSCERQARRPL